MQFFLDMSAIPNLWKGEFLCFYHVDPPNTMLLWTN